MRRLVTFKPMLRTGRSEPVLEGFSMLLRCAVCCLALTWGLADVGRGQTLLQEQLVSEGVTSLAKAARSEGDPQRGAILFHQPFLACAKCHAVGQIANLPATTSSFTLGPDLAKIDKNAAMTPAALSEAIVESILDPSKVIRKGFEPVVVQTADGKTVTGLLVEETADKLVLRDVSNTTGQGGALVTLNKAQIEERVNSKTSIMPAGQMNALAGRSQFLDLVRYLIEIAEGGPARAQQLQPPASLITYRLPEYERQIDHAGMLRDLDAKAFQRGEAIYNRLCINCHGTKDQAGSLPTSLKFAEGKFKNGADPHRMYQTLTHGFGLMTPQTWMVPQQKYDVIHYVRETYLKPHNPSQLVMIDETYLASLPKGTTRGPAPSNFEPWSAMNYGPYLMATYEVGSDGSNFAQKGIAVRLDPGPGGVSRGRHWMTFDHDTLRVSAAWSRTEVEGGKTPLTLTLSPQGRGEGTGNETTKPNGNTSSPAPHVSPSPTPSFIDWHGINFDGRHQIHPRVSGEVAYANPSGPGWANPETGTFDELRVLGRDDRRYGPLPRGWGRYRGLYQHGDQAIVSYTIGETEVLEMPGVFVTSHPQSTISLKQDGASGPVSSAERRDNRSPVAPPTGPRTERDPQSRDAAAQPVFTRTFQIGPRSREMLLKVATHPSREAVVDTIGIDADAKSRSPLGAIALLSVRRKGATGEGLRSPVRVEGTGGSKLPPAAPDNTTAPLVFSGKTLIGVAKANDFDLAGRDFTISARIKTKSGGTIFCQAPVEGPWAPDGKTFFVRGGRLTFDIGWVGAVASKSNVADDRWHDVAMTWQHDTGRVCYFVDGKPDGEGTLKPKGEAGKQAIRIGFTSPNFPDPTYFVGQIADVRFLQRRLKEDEITKPRPGNDDSLIAHWKLDVAKENVVRDETGKGHDGSVGGKLETAPLDDANVTLAAGLSPTPAGAKWQRGADGSLLLNLPVGKEPLKFVLSVTALRDPQIDAEQLAALVTAPPVDLASLTKGGPRRWPEVLTTEAKIGQDTGPFTVDVLTPPDNNPWFAQMRLTGFDFFDGGDRAAVCSWDGDVWLVSGLGGAGKNGDGKNGIDGTKNSKADAGNLSDQSHTSHQSPKFHSSLSWQRIASGLFQPLGLKIVEGRIYVTCRDQLVLLRDFNGDNETDFYECFNNDHQVTEHFHEFAMGLQTDDAGNFYYAKSGRHALTAVVPHHGTLLRVSKDGSQTDILATGFRAANGVCLNPDGSFVVTDQEGFWNPKNRINWVTHAQPGEKPNFYGNMFGYHDVTDSSDSAMVPPLCWITNDFDRSPAELLWVTSDKWGPLKGSLLNLSYGNGKVFVVPHETVARAARLSSPSGKPDGAEKEEEKIGTGGPPMLRQGGLCELPIPQFPTGIMRGRFSPADGQLYACGMFAWAGNQTQPGGFYRIRATGKPSHAPIGLKATKRGMSITFTEPLDPATASDATRYVVQTWSLKRTANYGSKHFGEQTLNVANVTLSPDRKTVQLDLPDIRPTWGMSIEYKLTGPNGKPVSGLIHNTIHSLGE